MASFSTFLRARNRSLDDDLISECVVGGDGSWWLVVSIDCKARQVLNRPKPPLSPEWEDDGGERGGEAKSEDCNRVSGVDCTESQEMAEGSSIVAGGEDY